jgi:transcription initiation factor IIE alpha subunit
MSDEELADRLCIVLKDVNRTAAKLREDKLLKRYTKHPFAVRLMLHAVR